MWGFPSKKRSVPQFLHGPRDGESAETVETTTSRYTARCAPDSVHLYIRRVDGHYDYAGVLGDDGEVL